MEAIHNGRPGDSRNFVHKRLIGAVGGFLTGGPLGAVGGFLGGGGDGQQQQQQPARQLPFAPTTGGGFISPVPGGAACPPGFKFVNNQCVQDVPGFRGIVQRAIPGGQTGVTVFGQAVLGQFGAALEPADITGAFVRLRCPRGTVLGMDDLCYNKGDIKNSERKWPRGRRPLLTGGEMRCIGIAAAAASKLERKQKQLQKLGLLKKPSRRAAPKALPGHHMHSAHD